MVLLEAMSQGLPPVCVNIPVFREILADGEYGLLTERKEKDFAFALNSLLDDAQLRNQYAKKAFARSQAYSMDKIGTEWLNLFQKLCKKAN